MDDLVCVYRTFDFFEANLIKAQFENEKILCFLKTNDASGVLPHLGLAQGGIELYVLQKDLQISQQILKEMTEEIQND